MGQPQSTCRVHPGDEPGRPPAPGPRRHAVQRGRSRDRSHYESFPRYHSALYRQVESTSVTPFSPRARDRGLHAVLDRAGSPARSRVSPTTRAASAVADHRGRARAIRRDAIARAGRAVDPRGSRCDASRTRRRSSTSGGARATTVPTSRSRSATARQDTARRRRPSDGEHRRTRCRRCGRLRDVDQESNLYLVRMTDMPRVKGSRPAQPADHDLRRRLDRRPRGRVVHGRRHRSLGRRATRTSTSRVSSASSWSRGFVVPPATRRSGHPGRAVPALVLVPEVPAARRAPRLHDVRVERCGDCNRPLVPSRFVMVCPRGHIDDFPYLRWVHEDGLAEGRHIPCASRRAARPRRCATSRSSAAAGARARWTRRSTGSRCATSRGASGIGPGSGGSRRNATSPSGLSSAARRTSGSAATARSSRSRRGPTRLPAPRPPLGHPSRALPPAALARRSRRSG